MSSSASARPAYHHGDLRNALIRAAAELAREGGPGSVTIRAAARAVNVTPTAAYRHFAGHEELLEATQERAMEQMAATMNAELARLPDEADPVRRGLRNLSAVGLGYLNFATAEPGLFRTCFSDATHSPGKGPKAAEVWGAEPFLKAITVIDELAEAGYLPPERRPMAEVAIWAGVHGLAMLFLDGPLHEADADTRKLVVERTFEVIAIGLGGAPLPPELREDLLAAVHRAENE